MSFIKGIEKLEGYGFFVKGFECRIHSVFQPPLDGAHYYFQLDVGDLSYPIRFYSDRLIWYLTASWAENIPITRDDYRNPAAFIAFLGKHTEEIVKEKIRRL